ncbi:FecCD family ABC transporter permease [Nocardia stercoris]|uniref:FecCD family ABC transporter permease n=1 Tax=Nocardia stercoris TaxID=2483361 RepID=UPI001F48B170|nr:iron chelate uptake ABC transporter family permease subunit [Nocardia stercoris]
MNRVGPLSVRWRPRVVAGLAAGTLLLFLLVCVDLARGDYSIPLPHVVRTLTGSGTRAEHFVIFESRLPRVLTAAVVGVALGLSGSITQSVLRNPLAAPDMLGITAGAGFAATAAVVTGSAGALGVPAAALAGGLVTAGGIYLLAWRNGVDGLRIVLIGIGVNAALTAGIGWLLVQARLTDVVRAEAWLNGSLDETSWDRVVPVVIGVGAAAVLALSRAHALAALRFGADTARSLGVAVHRDQALLLLAAVTAAAFATAAAGLVVFVALAAGQLARRVLRTAGEPLAGSALVGAILLVGSDIVARTLLPRPLPVGVVTAALGAPFLLYLLVRANRKASS